MTQHAYTTGALLSPTARQEGEREAPRLALAGAPPPRFDLSPMLPTPIWDQGNEGACTGFSVARLMGALWPAFACSRRDPYWQGRHLIGMDGGPDGAHLAAVLKAGQRWGYEAEADAPYLAGNRSWVPRAGANERRAAHHLGSFWRLPASVGLNIDEFAQALWAQGPASLVVATDEAFNEAAGGQVLEPRGADLGLHAIVAAGVDRERGTVLVHNSWGEGWGKGGKAEVSMLWLQSRLREAWQASAGSGDPAPRPVWEMLFPALFLEASRGDGPFLA